MLNRAVEKAYEILDGKVPDRGIFTELSQLSGEDILDLVSLAVKVKHAFSPPDHICTIINAKSGLCGEDCRFCAQSRYYKTGAERFPLVSLETILEKGRETVESGVSTFGIVTSGVGYVTITEEFTRILKAIDELHVRFPGLNVCASLGLLSDTTARELSRHGIYHYNINIQTNPAKYNELISSTHSAGDRIRTIELLKKYGVGICSGGIIGLGETMEDRLEMAFYLKDLDVDVIPLNVLIPLPGTPLENNVPLSAADAAKIFSLFRLIHPTRSIKFAAGRETLMKDFQGLIMLVASGFITGGYLTTRGRAVSDDLAFVKELHAF